MYKYFLLILILAVARVNAKAVATRSFGLALSNASPYYTLEQRSVFPRQLYLTRDSSGCLVPVSKSPHGKRNAQKVNFNDYAATPKRNVNSIASVSALSRLCGIDLGKLIVQLLDLRES